MLTNIDSLMKQNTHISCRVFDRCFAECSNMCKKVQFKRNLHAGKDVFNVKTPSKQKDYLLYLAQAEKKRSKKGKKRVIMFTQIKDIIEKHDIKVALRKKTSGKRALPRVRRTVSRLPNDFATQPNSSPILINDEADDAQRKTSKEDMALLNTLLMKKQHKVELDSLKKMIAIKRSLNHNLKRTKRARTEGFETFLRSDVTSSVSGRVRKANPKYGKEFAMSRRDFEEQRLFEDAHARLKRYESENKKIVENYKNKESLKMGKKRKDLNVGRITSDQPDSAKKAKMIDVIIDDVLREKCYVKSYESKSLRKKDRSSTKGKKRNGSVIADTDGVLIQDMPNEENVISDVLQNFESVEKKSSSSISHETKAYIKIEPDSQQSNQYLRAKQLLKSSLDNTNSYLRQALSPTLTPQVMPVPVSTIAPVTLNNKVIEQEKYRMLKIPETVQKLFTNKEIKKEPIEEASVPNNTSVPSTVNPRVVTVYSNGGYKKILLNAPPAREVVPTTKAQTNHEEISPAPILVNTVHGLRYLVPTQSVVKEKLPSYSEAVKTLSISPQLSKSSAVMTTSMSNVTLNTKASIGDVSGAAQSQKTVVYPVQYNQQQQQAGKHPKTVSLLSSVVTVPVSATSAFSMRPKLPTPTMNINTSVINKNAQQSATGMTNLTLTGSFQTQTLPPKSVPVVSSQMSHAQTVRSALEIRRNLSIPQQTVVSKRNSGIISSGNSTTVEDQNQKPIDKCKFYLLKIDGKNVLIPINGEQPPPKAYVINSDIIAGHTQAQNVSTMATVSTPGNVASPIGIRPTILGLQSLDVGVQQKPTMAVMPNMKLDQIIAAQGTASSPRQTVTLTNTGLVGDINVFNSSANTTQAVTNVLSPGNNSIKMQQVSKQSIILPKTTISKPAFMVPNINRTNDQPLSVPVYLRQLTSSQVSNNVVNEKTSNNSMKSHEVLSHAVKDNIAVDHDHKSYFLIKNMQTNKKQSLPGAAKSKDKSIVKTENEADAEPANTDQGKLCEKSGIFSELKTSDDRRDESKEPEAFKEAVTSREERLRRLKELLKEKQKAVEKLRPNKVKGE